MKNLANESYFASTLGLAYSSLRICLQCRQAETVFLINLTQSVVCIFDVFSQYSIAVRRV